nr:hypothetical protein [Tanacetum cinerariifolium]
PPGPTQKVAVGRRVAGDAAAVEHVAVAHGVEGGGGGEVKAALFAVQLALLKPRGGRAKDEIGGALDVAVLVILPPPGRVNREDGGGGILAQQAHEVFADGQVQLLLVGAFFDENSGHLRLPA